MAEAKQELVERVITGPKGIWAIDDKGNRYLAKPGETVKLSTRTAKSFARYCEAPNVAAAKAKVREEESKVDASIAESRPERRTPSTPKSAESTQE